MTPNNLIARGHLIGGGLRSPDHQWFVLSVPKNASSYTTNVLIKNGWEHWNLSLGDVGRVIVPLRDPVERWVSGTATYCCSYLLVANYGSEHFCADYNELVERLLVDNMIFDDHTTPQSVFVGFVPDSFEKTYVWVNRETFFDSMRSITGLDIIEHEGIYDNRKDSNDDISRISDFLKERLNEKIVSQIKIKYSNDYNMIGSVAIHGKR